jgi:Putative beta-barrel porin 2
VAPLMLVCQKSLSAFAGVVYAKKNGLCPWVCAFVGREMKNTEKIKFTLQRMFVLVAALLLFIDLQSPAPAQEAVSSTSTSGTSSSTSAPSATTTSDLSTETTAPSAAVTNSSGAASAMQTGPSGAGVFSPTPVKIYATISGGYDDNVSTLHNKQGSGFTSGNILLDYTFGDPRLQMILNGGAGATYYYEHLSGQSYDIDFKGALGITYKSSPRLTLGASLLIEYLTEPSFNAPGGLNSRNGNYLHTTDNVFVSYAWVQRFSTKTSYTFEAYNYDNNAVGAFSNRVSNVFGNEFRFQLAPTTNLVAEYRYDIVSYENASLNSTSHFALGGIDHAFNPRLNATLRGGVEFRSYDQDGDHTAPYFEGTVTYAVGKRVSVSWNTRYGLEEPDLVGSQSRTTFRTGFQTKFNLTSRISSSVDLYFVHDDYQPLNSGSIVTPGFTENTFDGNLSLQYAITPLIGVQAGYHYTDVNSDVLFREYSRNRVFAGVNLTF